MAMSNELHEVLKEKLSDAKIGDESVLDIIVKLNDEAEAKEKVQKANSEISKERDELKTQLKEKKDSSSKLESEVEKLKADNEKLLEGQLSEEDKKMLETYKGKDVEGLEAKVNTLTEQFETVTNQLKESREAETKKAEEAAEALRKSSLAELNTKLTNKLGDVKITGGNAELAIAMIEKQGMAKLNDVDGALKESFTIYKDGKPFEATIDELCSHIATTRENLVDSSGNQGPGQNHNRQSSNTFATGTIESLQDASNAAANLLEQFS